MKRIAGTFALLAGLSGCVTFTTPAAQGEKKFNEGKPAPMPASLTTPGSSYAGQRPMPYATWTADPGHRVTRPPQPSSLSMAPTTTPMPELRPVPPAPNSDLLPGLPAGMPMASTPMMPPRSGRATIDEATRQASFTPAKKSRRDTRLPEIVTSKPDRPIPLPPTPPTVKNSLPAEASRPALAMGGAGPLFRMVNTKQITLNFEVKDVGPSGLAGVDLWYTQDGKEWKKQEAPADAKFYKVEVDEEGMYGFTLVARSGIGLGKEPPAPGDQPQVWVIVDLTKPVAELIEAKATFKGTNSQQVAFKWTASDKNLGRQPVTLAYAEKPEGPWRVIAANLEACGTYNWDVPKGTPPRVLLRVEASDLAGNVGRAQSSKPIVLDNSMPRVSIVNVQANASR